MNMTRRQFLKQMGLLSLMSIMPISSNSWAYLGQNDNLNKPRLIVIFLRGAVDGLNVVVPYGDSHYFEYRPSIGLPRPGMADGILDLDGYFGLHPVLASVLPFWKENSLAFVHASGSPDPNRSHFEAQDYMESATPGNARTPDGWMNRLLGVLPKPHNPIQAVSFGETTPKSLMGPMTVANMPLGRGAANKTPLDRTDLEKVFNGFYNDDRELSHVYHEAITARKQLMTDLTAETKAANNGAPSVVGFASDTRQLAQLIAREPRVELAFLAVGGWDTHVNEGSHDGQLARHLNELGNGLAALVPGLGSTYDNTVIVVMSEFGRTAHENSNGGTDHGHGNVMWLMGGPIQGGKVYGKWPGLAPDALYQGRDLAVTTDFRDVLYQVNGRHFGLSPTQLAKVLPGFSATPTLMEGLIRA